MIKVTCEGDINTFWEVEAHGTVTRIYSIDNESPKTESDDEPLPDDVDEFLWSLARQVCDPDQYEYSMIGEFTDDGQLIRKYLYIV